MGLQLRLLFGLYVRPRRALAAIMDEGLCFLGDALLALERRDEARARFQAAIEAADTTPGYRRHEVREWRKHAARRLGEV